MIDYQVCDNLLWLYVFTILFIELCFYGILTLIGFIIYWCKLTDKKKLKKWFAITGAICVFMLGLQIVPAFIDIFGNYYYLQDNIVSVKKDDSPATNYYVRILRDSSLIIEDKSGNVYECYDYLYSIEEIEKIKTSQNNCIIYAKHSKLLLDWIPG